jgi:ribosomal protein S18 acetylase RimI-like enzyme
MTAAFRLAGESDVPAILRLMTGLYEEDGVVRLDLAAAERALRRLLAEPRAGLAWIAEEGGGEPAGYLVVTFGYSLEYHGPDAFIDELYVAPACRGLGLGRAAIAVAEAACRERGVLALHLEVERANVRAETLYRRAGFEDGDRRLMTRRLVGSPATGRAGP